MKKILLIPFLLLTAITCVQVHKTIAGTTAVRQVAPGDSVIVKIDQPNFKATFKKVDKMGKGTADGKFLFQRFGSLKYVISQLYKEQPVLFENNPPRQQNYEIDIKWLSGVNFDAIRKQVLQKIKEVIGYTVETDRVKQKIYHLSAVDESKLEKAANSNKIPSGYAFKSRITSKAWMVVCSLPRLAKFLSKRLNWYVLTQSASDRLYYFKLNIQNGIGGLKKQLRQKYGLALKSSVHRVSRVKITFGKSD